MWAAIPFFTSLLLICGFVGFRMYEERRGFHVWKRSRAMADEVVGDMYKAVILGSLPTKYREALIVFVHHALHQSVVLAVELLRMAERPLTQLSHRLRQQAPQGSGKEPSDFLKTISPGKKENGASEKGEV